MTRLRRARVAVGGLLALALIVIVGCSGVAERMFYMPTSGPTPLPPDFPNGEHVRFASADGTALSGWFLPAERGPTAAGTPAPTILQVHGNAGNIESHIGFTDFLPGAGFNLFIFDYRGYGESDGRARRRADLIADTEAALDVLLARADVDPDRIGLFGQSLGGAIGLNVMAERKEIRAAVIVSAFASWRDIAAEALGGSEPGAISRSTARLLINDERRPEAAIARIDRPVLILHGDADRVISVGHGERLAAAGPTAELVVLAGADHNSLHETHPEFAAIVVNAFRRYLEPASRSGSE